MDELEECFKNIVSVGVDEQGDQQPESNVVDLLKPLVGQLLAGDHLNQQQEHVAAIKCRYRQEIHER